MQYWQWLKSCTNCVDCGDGDVRLIGSSLEGRLEVCYSGVWGTVCNRGWANTPNSAVVCNQLGHSSLGEFSIAKEWVTRCACNNITAAACSSCRLLSGALGRKQ